MLYRDRFEMSSVERVCVVIPERGRTRHDGPAIQKRVTTMETTRRVGPALLGLVCLLASNAAAKAVERPNILWITAEDMSATLGCWGDAYAHTPNIDKLAAQSVRYTRAFATAPVCSPARSCLITGCYASTLGTQRLRSQFPIPDKIVGFPSLMRNTGYYCTNNVKTDYNTSNAGAIIKASWDECSAKAHWRNRKSGQPFFSIFNDMTSHQSRSMVWPYEQFRRDVQSRLAPEQIHDPDKAPVPPYYPDTPVIRRTVARYYDCVSVMDQNVGRLLRQLQEDGLAEDTIVFFYSDHGSGMPRHKRALLDTGMHVPLLIRFPPKYQHLAPGKPGESLDRLVSFVDFAPTLLSLLGITIPEHMQGVPFLGLKAEPPRQFVYGARDRVDEVFDLARSVRDGRYLYIRNFMPHLSYHQPSAYPDQGEIRGDIDRVLRETPERLTPPQRHYAGPTRPPEELYDSLSDPLNLKNLAASPHHRDVLDTMRKELRRWMVQTRDLGFLPEVEAWQRSAGTTPYEMAKDPARYPQSKLIDTASLAGSGVGARDQLLRRLCHEDSAVRYWAALGLTALDAKAASAETELIEALDDPSFPVRIAAANALAHADKLDRALPVLIDSLDHENMNVVLQAARTIELLSKQARPAVPAMRRTLARVQSGGDGNMFVRFSAQAFLDAVDE